MFLTIKLCTYAKLNCFQIEQIIYIKMDLALNNLQRLICHKTQQTKLLLFLFVSHRLEVSNYLSSKAGFLKSQKFFV